MAEAGLNALLGSLVRILGEKSRMGMFNKKYSGYREEIQRIRNISNFENKLVEMQFILGRDRLLDKIRKSIDVSKQEGLDQIRTQMNKLYGAIDVYNIFSRNSIFFGNVRLQNLYLKVMKRFIVETIRRLREGLSIREQNRYLNRLFPNSNNISGYNIHRQIPNELGRLRRLVGNRTSIFYEFKDRLEFLRKRSVGKKKKNYKKLIEYLENLQRIGGNLPNRGTRTRNETEFELENIRRINIDLYRALIWIKEADLDRFNHLFRILLNLPNRNQVYRYPNVAETIAFLDCLYDREMRVQRMLGRRV